MSTIERLAENATDDVVAAHIDSMRQFQQDLLQAHAEYQELDRRNAELVEAVSRARHELAALIPTPSRASVGDWPCENPADRMCLNNAYAAISEALAHTSRERETALPLEGKQEKAE